MVKPYLRNQHKSVNQVVFNLKYEFSLNKINQTETVEVFELSNSDLNVILAKAQSLKW